MLAKVCEGVDVCVCVCMSAGESEKRRGEVEQFSESRRVHVKLSVKVDFVCCVCLSCFRCPGGSYAPCATTQHMSKGLTRVIRGNTHIMYIHTYIYVFTYIFGLASGFLSLSSGCQCNFYARQHINPLCACVCVCEGVCVCVLGNFFIIISVLAAAATCHLMPTLHVPLLHVVVFAQWLKSLI